MIKYKKVKRECMESQPTNIPHQNYDILDLTKFILSIFIVAIHTGLLPQILYPWLRLAIPLFFIISSFLLHEKLKRSKKEEKWSIIKKYIKRQLLLYLFWFIVLLPITVIVRREWFSHGILMGIWTTISNTLFSSTFVASWYINATIIGTLIVEFLSDRFKKRTLFFIFIIPFAICCLMSSYGFLFEKDTLLQTIGNIYEMIFTSPVFSFPVSLIYILVGKQLAESDRKNTIKKDTVLLSISLICLFIEWKITSYYSGSISNDCLFMLLPCSYLSMKMLLLAKNITIKNSKLLRNTGIIMYPLHASLALVIKQMVKYLAINETLSGIINFFITLTICIIVSTLILKLEKNKKLEFLKYSH